MNHFFFFGQKWVREEEGVVQGRAAVLKKESPRSKEFWYKNVIKINRIILIRAVKILQSKGVPLIFVNKPL